eukprot:scaffold6566_cov125-Amphora_coffeaeformis.AAC.1
MNEGAHAPPKQACRMQFDIVVQKYREYLLCWVCCLFAVLGGPPPSYMVTRDRRTKSHIINPADRTVETLLSPPSVFLSLTCHCHYVLYLSPERLGLAMKFRDGWMDGWMD